MGAVMVMLIEIYKILDHLGISVSPPAPPPHFRGHENEIVVFATNIY